MLNCRPGDLAISVNTELPENEGTIVRVVRAHVNEPAWDFGNVPTWWCVSDELLTWNIRSTGRRVQGHEGPIPDRVLRPIRPRDPGDLDEIGADITTSRDLVICE